MYHPHGITGDDAPEMEILLFGNSRDTCFNLAVSYTSSHMEYVKDACSQAVLRRSIEDDADIHFAVHDTCTYIMYSFLLHSVHHQYEDAAQHSTRRVLGSAAMIPEACVASNADAL
jgi:hypothetical protein